jgi:hypothetical protein
MPMTVGCNEVLGITVGAFLAQARAAAPTCKGLVFSPPQPPTLNEGSALPCGGSDKLTFQQTLENRGCSPRSAANQAPLRPPPTPPSAAARIEATYEDVRSKALWHDQGADFFSGGTMCHGNSGVMPNE